MYLSKFLTVFLTAAISSVCSGGPIERTRNEISLALVPQVERTIDAGCIGVADVDSAYTFGLATCVGMAATAVRQPDSSVIGKLLCHVRCENAAQHIEDFKSTIRVLGLQDLQIAVSVVDPNLIEEPLRDAQRALNQAAIDAAREMVPGELWRVIVVTRDNLDQPVPKGTMRIHVNRQIDAEGIKVWDPRS